jgi:hypothetical protein
MSKILKTSEKQRLWDKFVHRLRERDVRMQLQQLFQQQEEKDWRAAVAKLFKKDLRSVQEQSYLSEI